MDGMHQTLRNLLRNLDQLQTNLEIQRRAVAISIRRVDLTRENLSQPRPPAAPGDPPAMFGDTAAMDLLNALSDLRNTQNNFMSVWLNHYATRMVLERDLGIMQLDEMGRWIEQSGTLPQPSDIEDLELPPPVPARPDRRTRSRHRASATRPPGLTGCGVWGDDARRCRGNVERRGSDAQTPRCTPGRRERLPQNGYHLMRRPSGKNSTNREK